MMLNQVSVELLKLNHHRGMDALYVLIIAVVTDPDEKGEAEPEH